ncbi:unnamed protein product [Didymodactylos carnosus]|uniref:Uncharacterized protein n=1 Tax=Didymodactylos carnosus TaxID=1234261 RepID=A0A814G560_9BILA|nr:unnamed protein product [Didymodactylos carnosus]CAF0994224.1 unnamed protein product [Didymodactylos carnosus]CAF3608867.1 unnamed protein product [Didymodactylos carnosus]CAF3765951.1 unnamed protein product [Didymodactylos carnosus]
MKLTLVDDTFRCLPNVFFRDAMGFLLVFDLTNEESFLSVRNWIAQLQQNSYANEPEIVLVGHKCDLAEKRVISLQSAKTFARELDIGYIEASALMNTNVKESFELLLNTIMIKLENSKAQRIPFPSKTELISMMNTTNNSPANEKTSAKTCC